MSETVETTLYVMQALAALFVFVVGAGILVVIVMYVIDKTQTSNAVPRGYRRCPAELINAKLTLPDICSRQQKYTKTHCPRPIAIYCGIG